MTRVDDLCFVRDIERKTKKKVRNRDKKDLASLNVIEAIATGAKCLETAPCKRDTVGEGVNNNQGLGLGQDEGTNGSASPAKT